MDGTLHKTSGHLPVVVICFSGALVCYLDRVGFPLAFTAISSGAGIDKYSQGIILSAFYNGYTFSQIPGGYAATKLGGRNVLIASFLTWTVLSITMSTDISDSITPMFVSRMLIGAAMGVIFPTMHTLLAQCTPVRVRTRCVATATSGMYFGGAAAMVIMPMVVNRFGASMIPKLVGVTGLVWLGLVVVMLPSSNNHVSDTVIPGAEKRLRTVTHVPWKRLLASTHVIAIICNNFTFHFAFFIVLSWMPTFTEQQLGVPVRDMGGLMQAVPHIIMFAASNLSGVCGDHLIQQRRLDVGRARKILNTIGSVIVALAMVSLPYTRTLAQAVCFSSLAMGGLGFSRGGFAVNHIDIAPKLAGIIMGISNSAGSVAGMIGPRLVGYILEGTPSTEALWGWQQAFFLPAFTSLAGLVVFEALATGERVFE